MNKSIKEQNVLFTLHTEFAGVAKDFREMVCEECNYSTPTFYRKMRERDRIVEGKIIPSLSNAEKDKIREIGASIKDKFILSIAAITKGK